MSTASSSSSPSPADVKHVASETMAPKSGSKRRETPIESDAPKKRRRRHVVYRTPETAAAPLVPNLPIAFAPEVHLATQPNASTPFGRTEFNKTHLALVHQLVRDGEMSFQSISDAVVQVATWKGLVPRPALIDALTKRSVPPKQVADPSGQPLPPSYQYAQAYCDAKDARDHAILERHRHLAALRALVVDLWVPTYWLQPQPRALCALGEYEDKGMDEMHSTGDLPAEFHHRPTVLAFLRALEAHFTTEADRKTWAAKCNAHRLNSQCRHFLTRCPETERCKTDVSGTDSGYETDHDDGEADPDTDADEDAAAGTSPVAPPSSPDASDADDDDANASAPTDSALTTTAS